MRQILIVEDEQPIREMIAFALRRAGYEVAEAEDCRQARVHIADRRPELVLVDWMLPDMSGLELTRLIKREAGTRDLPVIMLTARAAIEAGNLVDLRGVRRQHDNRPVARAGLDPDEARAFQLAPVPQLPVDPHKLTCPVGAVHKGRVAVARLPHHQPDVHR